MFLFIHSLLCLSKKSSIGIFKYGDIIVEANVRKGTELSCSVAGPFWRILKKCKEPAQVADVRKGTEISCTNKKGVGKCPFIFLLNNLHKVPSKRLIQNEHFQSSKAEQSAMKHIGDCRKFYKR